MEYNHTLCLYVSYYLSRFDREAYKNLGYSSMLDAHQTIGNILSVNPHTVKNMRDQFDPLHGHRAGWYQAPLSPSRVSVVRALENLDELTLRNIVLEILENQNGPDVTSLADIIKDDNTGKAARQFIVRGPTGRQAELFFMQHHQEFGRPYSGRLKDTREEGCGYDFEIHSAQKKYFVEVKGLAEISGGVLFTDKEWRIAKEKGEDYFLCVVKNVSNTPELIFINNPASKLRPVRNVSTTVQVNWAIAEKELNKTLNG